MKGRVGWKLCTVGRGIPQCRDYGAEYFEARKELYTEKMVMWAKGESSVKGHTEELGG